MASTDSEKLLRPQSYIDWVGSANVAVSSESDLFNQYKLYVNQWYISKNDTTASNADTVAAMYRELIKDITINYSTPDEKRFLSNINYNDPKELDIIVPYYATKIKQITQYIVRQRHDAKFAKVKYSLKGSEFGIVALIKNKILSSLHDVDFTGQFPTARIPSVTQTAKDICIEIESLYDTYQGYYDIDSTLSASDYTSNKKSRRYKHHKSGAIERNPNAWLDLTEAIESIFKNIPLYLATECDSITTSGNVDITLNYNRSDINDLPPQYFVDGDISADALIVNYQKQLVEKYAGTKLYYLSTGDTSTNYVSGELFTPNNPSANLLNRYFSSYATVPSLDNLKNVQDLGGFFIPSNLGVLNYTALEMSYELDSSNLKSNTVYVYPDPDQFAAGRGNTKTDQSSPYKHVDNIRPIKASRANQSLHGDIVNDSAVQKLYPYQSREESLKLQPQGISRSYDRVDFWKGDANDVWTNADIYPVVPLAPAPITARIQDLLISDNTLYEWKTDIYGNEYAIFKSTHPNRRVSEQISSQLIAPATQNIVSRTPNVSAELFSELHTNYYDYQLSGFTTAFEKKGSGSTQKSVYDKTVEPGHLYFRNVYSSVIDPLSSALSGAFTKHSASVLNEINNNIINFDLIKDYIIIQTKSYIVIEKLKHDLSTDIISSDLNKPITLSGGNNIAFEKFGNWWYDEEGNSIILTRTILHPYLSGSNYKIIYPDVYKFDLAKHNLTDIYTLKTHVSSSSVLQDHEASYNALRDAGLAVSTLSQSSSSLDTQQINIVSIDKPRIYYNRPDRTYSITFLGKDPAQYCYLYNLYLNTLDNSKYTTKQAAIFKPLHYTSNYHVDHFQATKTGRAPLSADLEGGLARFFQTEKFRFSSDSLISELRESSTQRLNLQFNTQGISGRPVHSPAKTVDTVTNTALMGQGLSSGDGYSTVKSNDISGTPVAPYTHNCSYLLYNVALSSLGEDMSVCFDVAIYTNTSSNSAYALDTTHLSALQRENSEFILTEDDQYIFA